MSIKLYTRRATEDIYGFYCWISCISSFEAKISMCEAKISMWYNAYCCIIVVNKIQGF
jgi:hypothetical protein